MIELSQGNRLILPAKHKDYLSRIITYSWYLAHQLQSKVYFFNNYKTQISSTLLVADLIIKSEWGDHPIAKEKFPDNKAGKWANNLALLEIDNVWNSKALEFKGRKFKSFKDWGSFGTHYTDIACFRQNLDQYTLDAFSTSSYDSVRMELINNYQLGDFELWQNQELIIKL